ncbi:MAG: rod shape-determining protein RodA [Bacteroidia bacterium]|nr:rod shape-determining protein RodA [Bacteroidia bacterium]MCF8425908.1 rod shape-determining protein RodA [Bacteroidia bacterium]MCF8446151.1 rod shape-determining protein RodA [Bacteroidia bacterium]
MTLQQPKPSRIDWITIMLYYFFVVVGLLCIYASIYKETNPLIWDASQNYGKQLIWIGVSSFLGLMILLIDEKFFFAFSYPIYGITILLLILVLVAGTTVKGSSSWIEIGGFRMQPAEFAKFGTALALAKFLSGYNVNFEKDRKIQILSAGIILLPMVIILLQNETGSTLVFTSFIFVLYREGLPGWILFAGFILILLSVLALLVQPIFIIIALVLLAILFLFLVRRTRALILLTFGAVIVAGLMVSSIDYAFQNVLQAHQRTRINVLLGKEVDIKGAGYNVQQSKIAIGSGGLWGKGFLQGTQNKFRFVPEQSTDFIFCTIGEEYGFAGSLLFISLYILLLYRLLVMAERQRQKFNRIYGYSLVCILFFHFVINIGMTLGLMPVIGIPLPFISYGGSALLSFTILLFIFIRLDANRVNELRGTAD